MHKLFTKILKTSHPRLRLSVFAFLPWLSFWGPIGSKLPDSARLRIAIAEPSCNQIKKIFKATVAKSNQSRMKGLSERTTPLSTDEAMLFVFESPTMASFWMKNTYIPLELVFFDKEGRFASIHEMQVEEDPKNPKRNFESDRKVVSALEVAPNSLKKLISSKQILCVEPPNEGLR